MIDKLLNTVSDEVLEAAARDAHAEWLRYRAEQRRRTRETEDQHWERRLADRVYDTIDLHFGSRLVSLSIDTDDPLQVKAALVRSYSACRLAPDLRVTWKKCADRFARRCQREDIPPPPYEDIWAVIDGWEAES